MVSQDSRPNILFAFGDDWGRYASAYRQVEGDSTPNAILETPNFDRVANEGVLFKNSFVPAPSCTPCRSSLLSGRYFWQTGRGAILQGAVWDSSIPTYPLILEEVGYHIGFTYKAWSPGTPKDAPYGADRTRYAPAGSTFCWFSHFVTQESEEHGIEGAKQLAYDEVRQNFDAFLDDRPEDTPFCYWWGPTNTHRTWERGSGKNLWGLEPDHLKGRLPDFLPDVHAIREDVCDYLGECQAFDAGLGILLDRLQEIGELDNTLIVVSGDHGIPGMPRGKCNLYDIGCEVALAARWPGKIPRGRIVDDMVNIKDLGPTFLEAAGVEPPECMTAISLLDVFESEDSGQVDPQRDFVVTGRERHVAAAREGNLPYPQRAIRTKDYLYVRNFAPSRWPMGDPQGMDDPDLEPPSFEKLCQDTFVAYADLDASPTKAWMIHHRGEDSIQDVYEVGFGKRPGEELYDLRNDPDHMQNLADAPEYQEIKERLKERLMRELTEQEDPRVTEEECRFEKSPFTDVPGGS
ncbi:MAG: sulfatase [Candidatus Brocadiia bacterium]